MPYPPPPPTEENRCQFTTGNWVEEDAAKADLDDRLAKCDLFTVFSEVNGVYVQPRYLAEDKHPRIDRLLIPKPRLVAAGWKYGALGIECKASGRKLGPIVAQCEDYSRAAFRSPTTGLDVMCKWIFIWPLSEFAGDIASVMTSNRIGGACGHARCLLRLKTACGNILEVEDADTWRIGKVVAGFKTGSR